MRLRQTLRPGDPEGGRVGYSSAPRLGASRRLSGDSSCLTSCRTSSSHTIAIPICCRCTSTPRLVGHRRRTGASVQPRTHRQHPRSAPRADRRGPPGVLRHLLQCVPRVLLAALDQRPAGARSPCARRAPRRSSCTARTARASASGSRRARSTATRRPHSSWILDQYSDGGWIWFDIVADEKDAVSRAPSGRPSRSRCAPARRRSASRPTTSPTTASRRCANLADSPDVLELVDRIFLIDQGDRRVDEQPEYAEVAASARRDAADHHAAEPRRLGRLRPSDAPRPSQRPESEFVQLLDDDVRLEPESIRRSIVFGRYATDADDRRRRTCSICSIDRSCTPGPRSSTTSRSCGAALYQEKLPHDFSVANLRQTPLLHMRLDADYNGWWMCLIPSTIIREVGLALPAFIKWDDAEYCLRAREHGFPTVSVPGRRALARLLGRQGRHDRLAGVLPRPQPDRRRAAALPRPARRHAAAPQPPRRPQAPDDDAVLPRGAARIARCATCSRAPITCGGTSRRRCQRLERSRSEFPETVVHRDSGVPLRSRRGRQVFKQTFAARISTTRRACDCGGSHSSRSPRTGSTPAPENRCQPEVEFGKDDAHWWRVPLVRQRARERRRRLRQEHLHARSRASTARCSWRRSGCTDELRATWPELPRAVPRGAARASPRSQPGSRPSRSAHEHDDPHNGAHSTELAFDPASRDDRDRHLQPLASPHAAARRASRRWTRSPATSSSSTTPPSTTRPRSSSPSASGWAPSSSTAASRPTPAVPAVSARACASRTSSAPTWMWLMDDDVEVLPDGLARMGEWAPRFKSIQGRRYDYDGSEFYWQYRVAEPLGIPIPFAPAGFDDSGFKQMNSGCFEGMFIHRDIVRADRPARPPLLHLLGRPDVRLARLAQSRRP